MAIGSNDIFISYGRGNENSPGSKDFCLKLYNALEEKGFDVWLDNQDIPHAVDFQKEINEGIKSSDNFVFVISPHATASLYCMQEIQFAIELNKRIIPILHIMPDEELLENSLHPEIKKLNWIYFNEADQFTHSLVKLEETLLIDQVYLTKHTEYTTKAVNWRENNRNTDLFLVGSALKSAENWLKQSIENKVEPQASKIQQEFISKSRKYTNYRTYRRIAAIVVFILVSSTLSLALYYSQQERIAAREALKNIQLANSNELVAKANTIQCEESLEMGLRIAALAYEADTTNEMAKTALFDTFYKTFKGDTVDEKTIEQLKGWNERVTGKKRDFAILRDANNIDYHNSKGEKLATFKSDKNFIGLHYDSDKQIIYAKTDEDEVVTYHLKADWVLKNIEKRNVPDLEEAQLNRYGIKKDIYQRLDVKLQRFRQQSPKAKNLSQEKNDVSTQQETEISNKQEKKNSIASSKTPPQKTLKKTAEDYTSSLRGAFQSYQNANENERLNQAKKIYHLASKASEAYPENTTIKRALITSNAYLANEYSYTNKPDSAILLVNKVLSMDAKQQWVNKIKVLSLLQKNDFDEAFQISKPLLDQNYPLAKSKLNYGELLEAELNTTARKGSLNQAQKKFLNQISYVPIEVSGFLINDQSRMTNRQEVSLKIYARGAKEMMISNNSRFSDNATWEPYKTIKSWKLQAGQGKKTVYIKFRNKSSEETKTFQNSILLSTY